MWGGWVLAALLCELPQGKSIQFFQSNRRQRGKNTNHSFVLARIMLWEMVHTYPAPHCGREKTGVRGGEEMLWV